MLGITDFSTCRHCGRPIAHVGRWAHWDYDGVGYGHHYYLCPDCGPFAAQFLTPVCPWCGSEAIHDHDAEP